MKANALFFEKNGASEAASTRMLCIYDLRTNKDFTLKTNPLRRHNLPEPGVIAQEIVEDLQAALEQFRLIAGDLGAEVDAQG